MKSQGASFVAFAFALFVPLIIWLLAIPNGAENPKNIPWVYLTCLACFAGAGWVTSKNWKFTCWSALVGGVMATLLCFAF